MQFEPTIAVPPPAAFASVWTPPVSIQYDDDRGLFTTSFSQEAAKGATTHTYYVDAAAAAGGNGLTPATAFDTLKDAWDTGNPALVYVKAGRYEHDLDGQTLYRNMTWIAYGGRAVIAECLKAPVWTQDGANPVWSTPYTRSTVVVADSSILDANGDYTLLSPAATLAACRTTAGSYYLDDAADTLYVHAAADRDFSAESPKRIYVYNAQYSAYVRPYEASNPTAYFQGFDFEGGNSPVRMQNLNTLNPTLCLVDCTVKYSGGAGGVWVDGGNVVCVRCLAARNGLDGFTYNAPTGAGGQDCHAIEIDCVARHNGKGAALDDGSDQGSTAHGASAVIRVNTLSYANWGQGFADVDTSIAWMLGCVARDSATASSPNGYYLSTAWLDRCTAYGTATAVAVRAGGAGYYRGGRYLGAVPASAWTPYV